MTMPTRRPTRAPGFGGQPGPSPRESHTAPAAGAGDPMLNRATEDVALHESQDAAAVHARSPDRGRLRRHPRRELFARVPAPLVRDLDRALRALSDEHDRITRQQLITALLLRYVRPDDPAALAHLDALLDDLDDAQRRR